MYIYIYTYMYDAGFGHICTYTYAHKEGDSRPSSSTGGLQGSSWLSSPTAMPSYYLHIIFTYWLYTYTRRIMCLHTQRRMCTKSCWAQVRPAAVVVDAMAGQARKHHSSVTCWVESAQIWSAVAWPRSRIYQSLYQLKVCAGFWP